MTWPAVALGDAGRFVNGFAFKPADWCAEGLPIVRIQNLTDPSKPINRTTRAVDDKFKVHHGDLLVSWSATLGVFTWTASEEAVVNQHIFRVEPLSTVDKSFLRHMLGGALRDMQKHLHGATMQHVNRAKFLGTTIPLPPIDEQRRIAGILDHADALRAKQRQVLEHLDGLTRAVFREMFGDRSDATAELGAVVTKIENGRSPICESRPAAGAEWGVLKLGAVTYGTFRADENKAYLGDLGSMAVNEVHAGDVLMTRKNTKDLVGAVALVPAVRERLLMPDLIFRLSLHENLIDRQYFQTLMMGPGKRREVQGLASGSAASMPNISKARLLKLPISVPPLSLQQLFARRAAAIEEQRARAQRALAASDELFASLQARAFRGEL